MTLDQAWNDDLSDPNSQAYQDAVDKANSAIQTMTGWGDDVDLSDVEWTFTEGSVIASATISVPLGKGTAADVQSTLENFDTSSIAGVSAVSASVNSDGGDSDETDNCSPNPCGNGATCVSEENKYTCQCPAGYAGTDCEVDMSGMLDAHNEYRATHHAPALTWSLSVSNDAQKWATYLAENNVFAHATGSDLNGQGENLAYRGSFKPTIGRDVSASWYNEVSKYDYSNPGFSMETGHFTQVVWIKTTHLGVGVASAASGRTYVVARYSPPGNYAGQYDDNVRQP